METVEMLSYGRIALPSSDTQRPGEQMYPSGELVDIRVCCIVRRLHRSHDTVISSVFQLLTRSLHKT